VTLMAIFDAADVSYEIAIALPAGVGVTTGRGTGVALTAGIGSGR
jgi:hypothetical protein